MKTADAVSPITTQAVTISLTAFVVSYAFVFGFGSYYLAKLLRKGPDPVEDMPVSENPARKPKRPFSLPDEGLEGPPGRRPPASSQPA